MLAALQRYSMASVSAHMQVQDDWSPPSHCPTKIPLSGGCCITSAVRLNYVTAPLCHDLSASRKKTHRYAVHQINTLKCSFIFLQLHYNVL